MSDNNDSNWYFVDKDGNRIPISGASGGFVFPKYDGPNFEFSTAEFFKQYAPRYHGKSQDGDPFEIVGLLWQHDTDDVHFSIKIKGDYQHASIPSIEARVKEYARQRGWSIGKVCDVINHQLRIEDERRNPPIALFNFQLSAEDAKKTAEMFGLPYEPSSPEQDVDNVDGDSE